jgi:hypothetical protein
VSPDELRIVAMLRRVADNYEARAEASWRGFFGNDRLRAELCRKLAAAIEAGKHR